MGNESSAMVDEDTPAATLSSRNLKGLGEYLSNGKVKNVVVMTGAGISTSAGIPDFRSPETGLYANLARLNLPYPEAVFDISFFKDNPLPFYTLAHELYPGKFRPTISHSFIRLLHDKGILLKHFTQNIDILDRKAGVPGDKIIEAHGSFARQSCIECRTRFPDDLMKEHIQQKTVPHCNSPKCEGLVKPEIVFFGEALPSEFFMARDLPGIADLAIVMGTSLTVQPFAMLPQLIPENVPRVLINLERVGGIGSRPDDVLLLGDCDNQVRKLCEAAGWLEQLEKLWDETADQGDAQSQKAATEAGANGKTKTRDELVDDEIDKLTKDIDKSLQVSADHLKTTNEELKKNSKGKTEAISQDKSKDDKGSLDHVYPHIDKEGKKDSSL